jgi:hypothetical protein
VFLPGSSGNFIGKQLKVYNMKTGVMPSAVQIGEQELKTLLTEVKETLAKDYMLQKPGKRKFGINDIWKIRQNARSASEMIRRY